MNFNSDPRRNLLYLLVQVARELPPSLLSSLLAALENGSADQGLERFAATKAMRERLRLLQELRRQHPEIDNQAIAFALQAASEASAVVATENAAEIAWTGPATDAVPLRRVDQVIYDMVESAMEEILLVTFVAYKAERVLKTLQDAISRGVRVKLIIELARESGGKLTFDGLEAFRAAVPCAQIYYWPIERRIQSATGVYGTMHAKCLVTDRIQALVSSANLTEHALERNIELGLLAGRAVARRLADHFDQLIFRGELVSIV